MGAVLDVYPEALTIPNIDTYTGLIHTFFALEDMYGLTITSYDGDNCICLGRKDGKINGTIFQILEDWQHQKSKLLAGEISKDEYDEWRYHYPRSGASGYAHVGDFADTIAHGVHGTDDQQ